MIRHVRHLFTGLALAAALSCSVFASAQIAFVAVGVNGRTANSAAIGTIDTGSGVYNQIGLTQLGATNVQLSGIAFSSTGVLYGVSSDAATLYTVNTTTGALTPVGSTGIAPPSPTLGNLAGGLAFSPTGTLYLTDQRSNLYTLSTTTGAASLVGPVGNASSATIGFGNGGNLYQINNDPAQVTSDTLLDQVDTTTGHGSTIGTGTGFEDLFGLAFTGGTLFGFEGAKAGGNIIALDTATGLGTTTGAFTLNGSQQLFAATGFVAAVPEPSTLALLMSMGVAGTSVFLRRKRATA